MQCIECLYLLLIIPTHNFMFGICLYTASVIECNQVQINYITKQVKSINKMNYCVKLLKKHIVFTISLSFFLIISYDI